MADEQKLRTEQRDPATHDLDTLDAAALVRVLHDADRTVLDAVEAVLPELARLVAAGVETLRCGGSVHYFGAGTSGRLAVLDAAELRPTFDLEPGRVVAHIAGGRRAVTEAVEGAEDDGAAGERDAAELGPGDLAIGIAASGRTPYVGGALRAARAAGARTALLANVPDPQLALLADHVLVADTGPEVLTGSTRLKAGTSAKLLLNGFSTAVMVGIGRTWSNLMVAVVATNAKLETRSLGILSEITGLGPQEARVALRAADGDLRTAVTATLGGCDVPTAASALAAHAGSVREALTELSSRR